MRPSKKDNARGQAGEFGKLKNTLCELSGIDVATVNCLGQISESESA